MGITVVAVAVQIIWTTIYYRPLTALLQNIWMQVK